jgi:hypothetical protein
VDWASCSSFFGACLWQWHEDRSVVEPKSHFTCLRVRLSFSWFRSFDSHQLLWRVDQRRWIPYLYPSSAILSRFPTSICCADREDPWPTPLLCVFNSFAPTDCHGMWAKVPWDQTRILPFFLLFVLAWFMCLVVTCGLKGCKAKPRCSSFILDFFSLVLVYYHDVRTEAPWNLLSYIPHPTLSIPVYSMMRELEDNGTLPSSWNCLSTSLCFLFKPQF